MRQEKYQLFPLYFFFFTASLGVCTIAFPATGDIAVLLTLMMMLFVQKWDKIYINTYIRSVFLFYFFPMLLATFVACVILAFRNDIYYYEYFISFLPSRLIHLFAFIGIFIYAHNLLFLREISILIKSLKIYALGIFFVLGIFGIWQILHNVLGIWIPVVETRNQLYFASFLGLTRVTSLADEPSYLVPFLIDAIIIFLYLKKKVVSGLLFLICLFSFSFGGYMEIGILFFAYILLTKGSSKWKFLFGVGMVVLLIFFLFPNIAGIVWDIIGARKELSSDFDVSDTARTAMIVYPWEILFQGNLLSVLFGNGPSSFKYLHLKMTLPNGENFHTTSNNLYTDVAYEGGIFSILCLIVFFVYLWKIFSRYKSCLCQREILFVKLFLIHIAASAFYRGDYISARFISLLLIIEIFYLIIQKNVVRNYSVLPA